VGKVILSLIAVSLVCAGCATTNSKDSTMISQLQYRLSEMERELEDKDKEIMDLNDEIKDMSYDLDKLKDRPAPAPRRVVRQTPARVEPARIEVKDEDQIIRIDVEEKNVQTALKKAGYYQGPIDGKVGPQTKTAITKFQQDHGLTADGLLGRKTWSELRVYLD